MGQSRSKIACLLASGVLLIGCSSRSVSAFCDELDDGMAQLQASTQASMEAENPLIGLAELMGDLGDFQRLLERLADVAPSEIQQDMEVVRDVMGDQMDAGDAASDPLGALASSLGASLVNQRSFERVDDFARENCGQPVFGF